MRLLDLLAGDNFIIVNKSLAKEIGLESAVILGEIVSEYLYWEKNNGLVDGWFYSTVENMQENTCLSAYSQREAIKELEELGVISVKKTGLPAKRYIYLNVDILSDMFNNKSSKNLTTCDEKNEQQDVKDFDTNNNKINNNNETVIINNGESKRTKFVKPTIEEIQAYINDNGYSVNAEKFYDYYEANGWYAGSRKMKDWMATVRNWERRDKERGVSKPVFNNPVSNNTNKGFFDEA